MSYTCYAKLFQNCNGSLGATTDSSRFLPVNFPGYSIPYITPLNNDEGMAGRVYLNSLPDRPPQYFPKDETKTVFETLPLRENLLRQVMSSQPVKNMQKENFIPERDWTNMDYKLIEYRDRNENESFKPQSEYTSKDYTFQKSSKRKGGFDLIEYQTPKGIEGQCKDDKKVETCELDEHGKSVCGGGNLFPILDPRFNLRECAKNLILLEDHLFHQGKRCKDCIYKHLLTIEGFMEEAITLDKKQEYVSLINNFLSKFRELFKDISQKIENDKITDEDCCVLAQSLRELRKPLHQKFAGFF